MLFYFLEILQEPDVSGGQMQYNIGSKGRVDYVKLRLLFGCPLGSSTGAQSLWLLQLLAEEEQTDWYLKALLLLSAYIILKEGTDSVWVSGELNIQFPFKLLASHPSFLDKYEQGHCAAEHRRKGWLLPASCLSNHSS